MAEAVNLQLAMGLPPARAIEYFRSKGYAIGWRWQDVWQEAQAKSFTVAKAARLEILHDIRSELTRALEQGLTERDFSRALEPRLKARGWWGRQVIVDAQGNAERVELGSPWRLKTIYRTNMQTAYMAGRHQDFAANTDRRPYWQYIAVMDERTRPAHRALHQRVFRHDDPIWEHFYPPNGFNCRCRVRALSARDVQRQGLAVGASGDDLRERWVVEPSTGFTAPVAAYRGPGMNRAISPDLGWSYNPGAAWARFDQARARADAPAGGGSAAGVIKAVVGQYTWRSYGRPDARHVPEASRAEAPAILREAASIGAAHALLAAELGVSEGSPLRVVQTPVDQASIRFEHLRHVVEKRGDARERYARFVLPTLTEPYEVWLTRYEDGYRKRYIGLFRGRRDLALIVREGRDGSLMWNAIPVDDRRLNAFREGALLYAKDGAQ